MGRLFFSRKTKEEGAGMVFSYTDGYYRDFEETVGYSILLPA